MNNIASSPCAAALSLALGIAGLLTVVPANEARAASISYNTNGTSICRATTSAGAGSFYYNNMYIWNGSASNQYLTCVFTTARVFKTTASLYSYMFWDAGATAGSVVCTAQMGAHYSGASHVSAGNTQTLPLAAGASNYITFPALPRGYGGDTIDIICNVPPGFKLGLMQNNETD